jgi:hypothetical protein
MGFCWLGLSQTDRVKQTTLEWLPVLAGMDLFSDLSPSDLVFAREMELVSLSQGQFLIRQDEPGDSLYVILEGQFLVTRKNDRGEVFPSIVSARAPASARSRW